MEIMTNKWGSIPWQKHLFSLCISGPKVRCVGWWFGLVLHKWGFRFGLGPYEVCIFWK